MGGAVTATAEEKAAAKEVAAEVSHLSPSVRSLAVQVRKDSRKVEGKDVVQDRMTRSPSRVSSSRTRDTAAKVRIASTVTVQS